MASCCLDNADNPNAPEYQKGWKSQHNAGCSCSCNTEEQDEEETTTVVRQKLTRDDFV